MTDAPLLNGPIRLMIDHSEAEATARLFAQTARKRAGMPQMVGAAAWLAIFLMALAAFYAWQRGETVVAALVVASAITSVAYQMLFARGQARSVAEHIARSRLYRCPVAMRLNADGIRLNDGDVALSWRAADRVVVLDGGLAVEVGGGVLVISAPAVRAAGVDMAALAETMTAWIDQAAGRTAER